MSLYMKHVTPRRPRKGISVSYDEVTLCSAIHLRHKLINCLFHKGTILSYSPYKCNRTPRGGRKGFSSEIRYPVKLIFPCRRLKGFANGVWTDSIQLYVQLELVLLLVFMAVVDVFIWAVIALILIWIVIKALKIWKNGVLKVRLRYDWNFQWPRKSYW